MIGGHHPSNPGSRQGKSRRLPFTALRRSNVLLLALEFLLHFVGDLHQPLHAADDHDAGANKKLVAAGGLQPGNLHRWMKGSASQVGVLEERCLCEYTICIPNGQSHFATSKWSGSRSAEAALTKILVRVHRCPMRAAVVVELPETDKLINCAGVGLEIADELLILPALLKRRKAKFLVELHGLCHRPDAKRICSQLIESHRKFLPG
jgi:hypothetical protein